MDTKTLQLENRIRKIREAVILDYKEFGIALLPLEIVMDTPLPYFAKMGTDGKKLFIAPHIIADQSDEKIATGLMHESLHILLLQCDANRLHRLIGPEPEKETPAWQSWIKDVMLATLAADYVINPMLKAAGRDVSHLLYNKKYEGWSWTEVFYDLKKQQPLQQQASCHIEWSLLDPANPKDQQWIDQMKKTLADFIAIAKSRGRLPGSMLDPLEKALEPEIPWLELVQDWVVSVLGHEDFSWRRLSRRGLANDLYLPTAVSEAVESLVFCSDTSQSMSAVDCTTAVLGVCQAASLLKIKKLVWIEGDTVVQRVLEFTEEFVPPEGVKGRGGTDFRPLIKEALKHNPAAIIYFTDLDGTFPTDLPPVPILWITRSRDGTVPYGKIVRID